MKMNKFAFLLKPFSNTIPFPIAPRNLDVPLMRLKNWTALGKFICTCGLRRLHFLGRKTAKGEKQQIAPIMFRNQNCFNTNAAWCIR